MQPFSSAARIVTSYRRPSAVVTVRSSGRLSADEMALDARLAGLFLRLLGCGVAKQDKRAVAQIDIVQDVAFAQFAEGLLDLLRLRPRRGSGTSSPVARSRITGRSIRLRQERSLRARRIPAFIPPSGRWVQ